ncbi:MAG: tyrosine-type recombinase/integrase [Acidimicrobiia bacterium]
MTSLAPTLEAFFTERLISQRRASSHTVASYRDTFRLLLDFAQTHTGKTPSQLDLADVDAVLVGRFLNHLEEDRGNSVRTRNNRLAAIHSLFDYAAFRHPDHAALIQRVLAIPAKRTDRHLVTYLTEPEVDALLAAPDRDTWVGRRDHTLILVAIHTGLRVSELTALTNADVELGVGAHLRCHGKGRKERITPLTTETVAVLRTWMTERQGTPADPLFPSRRSGPLTRDAVAARISHHTRTASTDDAPSMASKHVTPHVLRHTCAMRLLAAGVDTTVIALWLGHESVETTQIYLHADLSIKERAIARTTPTGTKPGRYRPPDTLLAFLEAL